MLFPSNASKFRRLSHFEAAVRLIVFFNMLCLL